jgi:CreA protein
MARKSALDTVFKLIGPDQMWWTPTTTEVAGVTCYVSRAKTGGIKAGWLAEDKAEASIACRRPARSALRSHR